MSDYDRRAYEQFAEWLILKRGHFYRPRFSGYTSNVAEAGRYTRQQAEREAAVEPGNFKIVLAPEAEVSRRSFQDRVRDWVVACFGRDIANDRVERTHRFLEEALELAQSINCTADEAHQLVDYVFNRPTGYSTQEAGGVMVTLAALCSAHQMQMADCGETELTRVWGKMEEIRAKQAAKPTHSPLPA